MSKKQEQRLNGVELVYLYCLDDGSSTLIAKGYFVEFFLANPELDPYVYDAYPVISLGVKLTDAERLDTFELNETIWDIRNNTKV